MNERPHGDNNVSYKAPTSSPPRGEEIDYVSIDRRKRAESIRNNEEMEREKRRRQFAARRKAERIRRAKIERLKAIGLLVVIGVGILCVAIGVITAVVKMLSKPKDTKPTPPDNAVSAEETALLNSFSDTSGLIYAGENSILKNAGAFLSDTSLQIPSATVQTNEFGELSRRLGLMSTSEEFSNLKAAVRDVPMFSNGYVWSETQSIRSSATGGYLYDTNTSFLSAVANICLWEGDSAFLSETDTDTQPKLDSSYGKTVLLKLEAATDYLFDGKTAEGGLKYDPISGLVYIHTAENNGTSSGLGSNRWHNFRFGYLDAYTNISFYRAMRDLAALYTFLGQNEKSDEYTKIADKHAAAFNEKFWDTEKQRYIGCVDINGAVYDYGFVFLNLEAIEAGLADQSKAEAVFAWLDGKRVIEGDTATGSDIYAYAFAPRSTTLAVADNWWDYQGGRLPLSAEGGWGKYVQNGGTALSGAYYDILARHAFSRTEEVKTRLSALTNAYADGSLAASDSAACRISGDPLTGLAQTAVLRTVFGITTDGFRLCVLPDSALITPPTEQNTASRPVSAFGVRGIGFAKNTYGFLFDGGNTYVTAVSKKPVRLRIGGFEAGASYELVTVENALETTRVPIEADAKGNLEIAAEFGSTSYLKITAGK